MAIFGDDGKALTSDDLKSKSAPQDDEPGWFQPGSQSDALVRGLANGATLGTGKYIGGAVNGLVNGDPNKSTWQNIKDAVNGEVGANKSASDANPYTYGAGNLVGGLPIALASGGAGAAPEAGATGVMAAAQKVAALKSVPAQMAKNAATGAVTAAADNPDNPLGAAAGGAATGAGLSGAAGLAGKAISAVGNKVTSSMGSKRVMDTIKDLTDTSKKANMGGETQSTVDMFGNPTTTPSPSAVMRSFVDTGNKAKGATVGNALQDIYNTQGAEAMRTAQFPNSSWYTKTADVGTPVPAFSLVKDYINNAVAPTSLPTTMMNAAKSGAVNGAKQAATMAGAAGVAGLASGLGGMAAIPGAILAGAGTSALQGAAGAAKSGIAQAAAKDIVNGGTGGLLGDNVVGPAAQAGIAKLRDMVDAGGTFSQLTGFLNQTSPEVRAALNPENPLNRDDASTDPKAPDQ